MQRYASPSLQPRRLRVRLFYCQPAAVLRRTAPRVPHRRVGRHGVHAGAKFPRPRVLCDQPREGRVRRGLIIVAPLWELYAAVRPLDRLPRPPPESFCMPEMSP